MSISKILLTIILWTISGLALLNFSANAQNSEQNENTYTFHYNDREARKIELSEYAMLRSAEYAMKKGFKFFELVNTRHYDANNKSKTPNRVFGSRRSKRPKPATELTITCFEKETGENSHNARMTREQIKAKYKK